MSELTTRISEAEFASHIDKLYKDEPVEMVRFLAISAGKACAEAKAGTIDVKTQCTYKDVRYEVKVKVSLKKIR